MSSYALARIRGRDDSMRLRAALTPTLALLLFVFTVGLYTRTMAPGALMTLGDPGDLQAAVATLGVPHPTGYPLFVLTGWLWVHLLPVGTVAFRLNLLVAVCGALAVSLSYLLALRLTDRHLPAVGSALLLGLSYTFWTQTSISEVYTLNAVFVAAVLYLLVRWGQSRAAAAPDCPAGGSSLLWAAFVYGLSMAHHRTMILLLPAIAVYVAMVDRRVYADRRLLARLLAVALPGPALYVFTFVRLMPQGYPAAEVLWGTVLGGSFIGSLGQSPDWANIFWLLPVAQVGVAGLAAAALGWVGLLIRPVSRRPAILLLLAYLGVSLFCLIYRIPEIDPFLIPAFLILAVGISGLAFHLEGLPNPLRMAGEAAMALLPLLLVSNMARVPDYWAAETGAAERNARLVLAAPLEAGAAIEADWNTGAALRYLQASEGLRPDLEVLLVRLAQQREYDRLGSIVSQGRAVYLLKGVELSRLAAPARWDQPAGLADATRLTRTSFRSTQHTLDAALSLQGYLLEGESVTLYWQALAGIPADYSVALDYLDASGTLLGQDGKDPLQEPLYGFRTSRWAPGATVADIFRTVPAATTYLRASLLTGAGRQGQVWGRTAVIQVRPATGIPRQTLEARFGDEISLAGYNLTVAPSITLTLTWQPLRSPQKDYTVFVHVVDASGAVVAQDDSPPVDNVYPTTAWRPGDVVRDVHAVNFERQAVALRVGLYDRATMLRLPVTSAGAGATDYVTIPLPELP
jgi:hypothetical protein